MTEIRQITKDNAYDAVAPDDFPAMMEVDRYNARSTAFDKIISATHDHFWDPLDVKYIDFTEPFDLENQTVMPAELIPELKLPCFEKLSQAERVRFANESARWMLSSILHGEAGALALSASLCHILRDPGAQEYAANQTREEARHVTAFAKYVQARWGKPLAVGPTLGGLLTNIVNAPEVYKKIVGMQMLVEGLAMGAFATLYAKSNDPLLVKLTQLVMTDEAFHHKFGKIWADRTIPNLSEEEQNIIEDWAAECFQTLLFNLVNPEQKQALYGEFGLTWEQVQTEMLEAFGDDDRRESMKEGTNIFRVLIKTLLKAGIITDRTKAFYAVYVNMEELKDEGERMVGDDIAEDGIRYLQKINFGANVDALKEVTISAAE
ncbi:MAG: ferritin-like domain-containing protein [Parvibaculum sp.]|uniref:ferritin-like domain-containing protein n=1 Tax=Parvibaculum sp. TaxID=2024848 RepID=UPI002AB96B14|nr:ferritin-like domain-containing protein [Parvibaculum sp.]MDZ4380952.1 ferritin-like domain-containing protein [Parvibaculum sp.]